MESEIPVSKEPDWNTKHILLDIPSFRPGQEQRIETLLSSLPRHVTIWGGHLNHPALEGYCCHDLLRDEIYLLENAAITADCTLGIIQPLLNQPWEDTKILIIGWGRIGKCLAPLLKAKGCTVTVSAHKANDLHTISSSGYEAVETAGIQSVLHNFNLVINTVPFMVLPEPPADILKIDLASKKGIGGEDVVWARGLPGIHAPERSGKLIAATILRLLKEEIQ